MANAVLLAGWVLVSELVAEFDPCPCAHLLAIDGVGERHNKARN